MINHLSVKHHLSNLLGPTESLCCFRIDSDLKPCITNLFSFSLLLSYYIKYLKACLQLYYSGTHLLYDNLLIIHSIIHLFDLTAWYVICRLRVISVPWPHNKMLSFLIRIINIFLLLIRFNKLLLLLVIDQFFIRFMNIGRALRVARVVGDVLHGLFKFKLHFNNELIN